MRFLVLCSFDNYIDANLLLGRLQEEGINCWLQDEHTVTIDPIVTNAIGGIKLLVYFSQIERARDLLQNWQQQQVPVCPYCGSAGLAEPSIANEFSGWLSRLFRFLQGKKPIASAGKPQCMDCGTEWIAETRQYEP